jgi:hypothetical protein
VGRLDRGVELVRAAALDDSRSRGHPGSKPRRSGVVDQDVDLPQFIGDPITGGFDRRRIAEVER